MRVAPDQFNYRSPQKYVSTTNGHLIEILLDGHIKIREGLATNAHLRYRRQDEASKREH